MTIRYPSKAAVIKPIVRSIKAPPAPLDDPIKNPPGGGINFLLLETGDFILLEDGGAGIYTYDFTQADGAPTGFTITSGSAAVASNQLVVDNDFTLDLVIADTAMTQSTYSVEADFTTGASYSAAQRAGLVFRYVDNNNYYRLEFKSGSFGGLILYRRKAGVETNLAQDPQFGSRSIPNNVAFNLRVDVSGTTDMTADMYLNDVLIMSHTDNVDPLLAAGQVGIYQSGSTGDDVTVDNLVADESVPATDKILLEG